MHTMTATPVTGMSDDAELRIGMMEAALPRAFLFSKLAKRHFERF